MKKPLTDEEAFAQLIAKDGYGYTKVELGKLVGISKQAVGRWKTVPVRYVTILHEKTGIPKAWLRPSDFS